MACLILMWLLIGEIQRIKPRPKKYKMTILRRQFIDKWNMQYIMALRFCFQFFTQWLDFV